VNEIKRMGELQEEIESRCESGENALQEEIESGSQMNTQIITNWLLVFFLKYKLVTGFFFQLWFVFYKPIQIGYYFN
jgi:hypothetical protein